MDDHKFKAGQQVTTIDEDTGEKVGGIVTDTSRDSVFIKWEDITDPCEHYENEYHKLKIKY